MSHRDLVDLTTADITEWTIVDFCATLADPNAHNNSNRRRLQTSFLSAAIQRAGLGEVLSGPGPFTLFAPNDAAFGALSDELQETLFENDEFIPHLADLILYHVLAGEFFAADLRGLADITGAVLLTLNGEIIDLALPPLTVNGVNLLLADNDVSNGGEFPTLDERKRPYHPNSHCSHP